MKTNLDSMCSVINYSEMSEPAESMIVWVGGGWCGAVVLFLFYPLVNVCGSVAATNKVFGFSVL